MGRLRCAILALAVLSTMSSRSAAASESLPGSDLSDVPEVEEPAVEPEATNPEVKKPAPYSLPWHLRSAVAATTIRSDTTLAFQDATTTVVSFVSASWKVIPDLAIAARYGWVYDAPKRDIERCAFTNVGLSASYGPKLTEAFRIVGSGGVVLPVGEGGGNTPDTSDQKAIASGSYARSAMDNAMFAPNDLGLFLGAALAYIEGGFTMQLETTFFHLMRVKGEANQVDGLKTNTTWGLHAGYFLFPELSIGAELRYQDFISPPKAVQKAPERRDCTTAEVGLRAHLKLGAHAFRPGVAYGQPIDDPMAAAGYRIVQVDLPFVF